MGMEMGIRVCGMCVRGGEGERGGLNHNHIPHNDHLYKERVNVHNANDSSKLGISPIVASCLARTIFGFAVAIYVAACARTLISDMER